MDNLELDHISSLEQTLCSNFTCCSLQLPDLHALVEHVEDSHVLGDSLFPFSPLPSLSHTPSSSRSSSVLSSPQTPTTPLDPVYTSFNIGIGLYDHDLEFGPDPYPVMSSPFDSDSEKSLFILESSSLGNTRILSKKTRSKADIVNTTPVFVKNSSVKSKARIYSSSSSSTTSSMTANGKRREKAFRCPTLGCTKSYLNPNGLKYHIEKGTCRFEETYGTDFGSHTPSHHQYQGTIPTAPSTSTQTPPLSIPLISHPSLVTNSNSNSYSFYGSTSNETSTSNDTSTSVSDYSDIDNETKETSASTSSLSSSSLLHTLSMSSTLKKPTAAYCISTTTTHHHHHHHRLQPVQTQVPC